MITLLSKTADTNQFLRDDAVKALEAMTENVPPQKALTVIITNGITYDDHFALLIIAFRVYISFLLVSNSQLTLGLCLSKYFFIEETNLLMPASDIRFSSSS